MLAADSSEYKQILNIFPNTKQAKLSLGIQFHVSILHTFRCSNEMITVISGKPFKRGFNIVEKVEVPAAIDKPINNTAWRKPTVPQVPNLRLRFRPSGYGIFLVS